MNLHSIALGGGGTRGGLHIGALRALLEVKGNLEFPDGIYGASVGAIIGAAVAFRIDLDRLEYVYGKYFTMSTFVPSPKMDHVLTAIDRKGLFSMDHLESVLIQVFQECGVDLRGARICDAPQPLRIVASNMTTGRPTILTGKVPVLAALLCSSCVPGLFEPQELYGDIYLDGGVHLRCVAAVVPKETLVIHISGTCGRITSKSSLHELLSACYGGRVTQYFGPNICRIKGVKFGLFGELTAEDRAYLAAEGYSQTLAFLTQPSAEEGQQVLGGDAAVEVDDAGLGLE
jgi:hypothetical protein